MNMQEIFDTVAKHLFVQGARSVNAEDGDDPGAWTCLYRGPNGTKCAVGAILPDEYYKPEFEYNNITHLLLNRDAYSLPSWMYGEDVRLLLRSLQRVHDEPGYWCSSETMRQGLATVAKGYNLDAGVLEGLRFSWEKTDAP